MLRVIYTSIISEICGENCGRLLRNQCGNIINEEEMSALARARRIIVPIFAYMACYVRAYTDAYMAYFRSLLGL